MGFLTDGGAGYKQFEWTVKGGWVYKDGEKFFGNFIHYPAIYNDAMRAQRVVDVSRIRQTGFNGVHAAGMLTHNFVGTAANHDDNLLNTLLQHGMFAIVATGGWAGLPEGEVPDAYTYFADHPSTFALAGYDDAQSVSPQSDVFKRTATIKARFPGKKVYNTAGTSNSGTLAGAQDIIAFQRYPLILDNGATCYESMASATSNMLPVLKPNLVANQAVWVNTQAFKWYAHEPFTDPVTGQQKVVGNPAYPVPTMPTEPHYRSSVYQALTNGATGLAPYAWADWVYRAPGKPAAPGYDPATGLTQENNLTTNTALRNAISRVNGELATFMPFIKYGERFPILMPSESYAAAWLYQGKILVLAINGKATAGTISTTNECPFIMKSKPRPVFQHVASASLTNTDKSLTFTNIPWNASEAYIIDLAD